MWKYKKYIKSQTEKRKLCSQSKNKIKLEVQRNEFDKWKRIHEGDKI